MKTQILLMLELDPEAEVRNPRQPGDPFPLPTPHVVLGEVNATLRQWLATNPFDVRDIEHVRLSLALAPLPAVAANGYAPKLANDLRRMAGDLNTLANLTEKL